MTVCESCKHLCNGLGPFCDECRDFYEEQDLDDDYADDDFFNEEELPNDRN